MTCRSFQKARIGFNRNLVGCVLVLGVIAAQSAWCDERVPSAYRAVALNSGVPVTLFYAVALNESGRFLGSAQEIRPWPWTLNHAGTGYFFASRWAAWRALAGWLEQGNRSIDIGLMQVNWRYHQERFGSPWQALDPTVNLRVGAEILKDCYSTSRDWWTSVGCYHAPGDTPRAEHYRRRVYAHWQRLVNQR